MSACRHIRKLLICNSSQTEDIDILSTPKEEGKSHFENRGKAHDAGVITEKHSIFPTLRESKSCSINFY